MIKRLTLLLGIVAIAAAVAMPSFAFPEQTKAAPLGANPTEWGLPSSAAELVGQRTRQAKLFQNADGTLTAIIENEIHYKNSSGQWKEIDLSFVSNGSGYLMDSHRLRVSVGRNGVDITESGKGIRWNTPGQPSVAGRKTSYVKYGLTWEYLTTKYGLKLGATVSSSRGPRSYTFTYSILGGGSNLTIDEIGNAQGDNFTVRRPYVTGANAVIYKAGPWELLAGPRIGFKFDDSTLPPEAYPYVIDPTTHFDVVHGGDDGSAGANAAYSSYPPGPPNTAASTDGGMQMQDAKYAGPDYILYNALVRWDTSSLPDNATITAATLRLYVQSVAENDGRDLIAEWYVHDGSISTGDFTSTKTANAHGGTDLTTLTTSANNTFTLINLSNISLSGYSGVRLQVSGGVPSGVNQIYFATVEHASQDPPRLSVTYSAPSAAITGTIGDGATEQEVRDGGGTIIVTLTDFTWVASGGTFDAQRQGIIDGLDAAESETNGWNAQVRDQIAVGSVVRTSSTVATITISQSDVGGYRVASNETITVTVPNAATSESSDVTATPTIAITAGAESAVLSGTVTETVVRPAEIVAGAQTIVYTLTNTLWADSGSNFNAQRQTIIDHLASNLSDQNGWNTRRADFAVGDVVRTSPTVVTITLSASSAYAIPATETITASVPNEALIYGADLSTSTFDIIPTFASSGNRVSAAIDLSSVTDVAYCSLAWEATTPASTTATVDTSVNGGSSYTTGHTNGNCPSGVAVGSSLVSITDFRIRVNLTTSVSGSTPTVDALALIIEDTSGQELYYQLNTVPSATLTDRSSGGTNTGTMSFPVGTSGVSPSVSTLTTTRTQLSTQQALISPAVASAVTGSATDNNLFNTDEIGWAGLPGKGIVDTIAAAGDGLPTRFVWFMFLGLLIVGMGFAAISLTQNLFMAAAAMGVGIGLTMAMGNGLLPGWIIYVFLPMVAAFLLVRKGLPL